MLKAKHARKEDRPSGVIGGQHMPAQILHVVFPLGRLAATLLFIACAFSLIGFSVLHLWQGVGSSDGTSPHQRLNAILESMALLTVAVAALQLGQTILEEEVQREAHMSAPTRVRRFLSRFMIVLVVALSLETLVLVFRFGQEAPSHLLYAMAVGVMAAGLLAAWGVFIRMNRSAEELEPEAMRRKKKTGRSTAAPRLRPTPGA